jgi:hypothetical protein
LRDDVINLASDSQDAQGAQVVTHGVVHRVIFVNVIGDLIRSKARDRDCKLGDMTWRSTHA